MNLNSRMRASSHSAVGEGPRAGEPGWGWGAIPCWPLQGGKNQTFLPPYAGARQFRVPRQAMYVLVFRVTAPRFVLMFPFPLLFINLFVVLQPPQLPSWLQAPFPRGQTFRTKFTFHHLITTWVFMATWNPMFMVWLLSADPPFVICVCPSFLRKPSCVPTSIQQDPPSSCSFVLERPSLSKKPLHSPRVQDQRSVCRVSRMMTLLVSLGAFPC